MQPQFRQPAWGAPPRPPAPADLAERLHTYFTDELRAVQGESSEFVNPVPPARGEPSPDADTGVRPWHPPAGFVDPVPSGRWERTLTDAGLRERIPQIPANQQEWKRRGKRLRTQFLSAAVAIVVLLKLAAVTDLVDLGEILSAGESNPARATLATDGKSSLPGGRVSVRYEPLPGQRERRRIEHIDAPFDGSTWSLAPANDSQNNYMMLAYYVLQPPLTTEADRKQFLVQDRAANSAAAGGKELDQRERTIHDLKVYETRLTMHDGDRAVSAWILGPVHSYRFVCRSNPSLDEVYRQCLDALKTLRAHQ
ncbi:MAG: hypothetical protein WAP35_00100 [Solirubrobacterales bacterium]